MNKEIIKMTIFQMEQEITNNRIKMCNATGEEKRKLIIRNHKLMTEIDARYDRGLKNGKSIREIRIEG